MESTDTSPVKLHYFDIHGKADPIRLFLYHKNIEFEDHIVKGWKNFKFSGEYPFQQLPVLDIDGKRLAHCRAIFEYVSRKFDMVVDNPQDAYSVEYYSEGLNDLFSKFYGEYLLEKDETKRGEIEKGLLEDTFPLYFKQWESHFTTTKRDETGYLAGKLTFADFKMVCYLETWLMEESRKERFLPVLEQSAPSLHSYLLAKISGEFGHYFKSLARRPKRFR
mmetsp:Transcript_10895/g.11918  ORF Transcript_10895/g.11918 Transcript_10895/m.11918 type:complete len:221 (-) Transcript_10895:524-1186(-)